MVCPQCNADDRLITKTGAMYRRKTKDNPFAQVQGYLCTRCGYKARGKMFGLEERMVIKDDDVVLAPPVINEEFIAIIDNLPNEDGGQT
jgi:Zn ribbon nucleic-acid-binding protein